MMLVLPALPKILLWPKEMQIEIKSIVPDLSGADVEYGNLGGLQIINEYKFKFIV